MKDSSPEKLQAWASALKEVTSITGWRGELYATG